MKRHIAQGVCTRCEKPFGYYRAKKPKIYCCPCRAKERRDSIRFHNSTYYWLHKVAA